MIDILGPKEASRIKELSHKDVLIIKMTVYWTDQLLTTEKMCKRSSVKMGTVEEHGNDIVNLKSLTVSTKRVFSCFIVHIVD